MKALIDNAEYQKSYETRHGILHKWKITYYGENEKLMYGYYSSKSNPQTKFVAGQESEFTTEIRQTPIGDETVIKPVQAQQFSNYARKVKQEQSRYSGFAMSYAKDLVIADKVQIKDILPIAKKMFDFMVELDKSLES